MTCEGQERRGRTHFFTSMRKKSRMPWSTSSGLPGIFLPLASLMESVAVWEREKENVICQGGFLRTGETRARHLKRSTFK